MTNTTVMLPSSCMACICAGSNARFTTSKVKAAVHLMLDLVSTLSST